MNRWLIIGTCFLPFLIMVIVNLNFVPSIEFDETKCTRYCHNNTCEHFFRNQNENRISSVIIDVYTQNINWLKSNPFGLSYQQSNLVLYVFIGPLLILFLLWGVLRKRNG